MTTTLELAEKMLKAAQELVEFERGRQPKPEPVRVAPPVDTMVEVPYGTTTAKRYSAGSFDRNGELECWRYGATSKTAACVYGDRGNSVYSFSEWRIVEDNEGWIKHNGSSVCPIDGNIKILRKYSDGIVYTDPMPAMYAVWYSMEEYKIC